MLNQGLIVMTAVLALHSLVPAQQAMSEEEAKEFTLRRLAKSRTVYLTRARTIGPSHPPFVSLRPLLSSLEKRGFKPRATARQRLQELPEQSPMRELDLLQVTKETSRNELSVMPIELRVKLLDDSVQAENTFVHQLTWIQIPPKPGTVDGRLVGENSAYSTSDEVSTVHFYLNNAYVSIVCGAPLVRTRTSEVEPFPRKGLRRNEPKLPLTCTDIGMLVAQELQSGAL